MGKKKKTEELSESENLLKDLFDKTIIPNDQSYDIPYTIPFRHAGLQYITGGIPVGKVTEIHGESGSGKSYLLYELMSEVCKMGGFCLLSDVENAYSDKFGAKVGIDNNRVKIINDNRLDMNFKSMRVFVKKIREKLGNDVPILLGIDSYPALQTQEVLSAAEKEKNPAGYHAAKKVAEFSSLLSEFVSFLSKTNSSLVLLNQTRHKIGLIFGDDTTTNANDIIQYYATIRLRGKVGPKLMKEIPSAGEKKQIGVTSRWITTKNRIRPPFIPVATKIYYREGVDKYSGLLDLLALEEKITKQHRKEYEYQGEVFKEKDIAEIIEKYPEILEFKD